MLYGTVDGRYGRGNQDGSWGYPPEPTREQWDESRREVFDGIRPILCPLAALVISTGLMLAGNGIAVVQSGLFAFSGALLLLVALGMPGGGIADSSHAAVTTGTGKPKTAV